MAGPKEIFAQIFAVFSGLNLPQKVISGLVVVVVFGGMVALTTTGSKVDERVLFSGLAQQDAAEVVQRLRDLNVPYRLSDGGGAIMVPAGQVHELRLTLAGDGLPRGGGVGFEVFDEVGLGTTDFVNRLNFQRAMQGELARTIRQFQQVQEARVHIATPKESVFIEDEKPVTASISVQMRGREQLTQHQIQSIVNLVASAVPGLSDDNITLVDTAGRLLYRKRSDMDGVLSGSQLEFQHKVEETARRKVESMLEEVVGINRVRASVTADIDFSRVNLTEESFDPEEQVVRSEQLLTESDQRGDQARGIPGVKGELATFAGEGGGDSDSAYQRSNVTRNYEISRQTRQVQESGGGVRRLSVAVMVDGTYERVEDENGRTTMAYRPRSPEEMAYFERLVRNAVGYSDERGDQVEVASMPFALSSLEEPEVDPMDKWREIAEWLAMPMVYLVIAFGVMLFVLRPFFRMLATKDLEAKRAGQLAAAGIGGGAGGGDDEDDTGFAPKGLTDQERIYRLAQSDPDRAADLVRRWLREEV